MLDKIVVALDGLETQRPVLGFARAIAYGSQTTVHVVHVRERPIRTVPFLETRDEAARVVEGAVFDLRMAGIKATGRVLSARIDRVAAVVGDEAKDCGADAIVVGCRRRRGIARLHVRGMSKQMLRESTLPLLVIPVPGVPEGRARPTDQTACAGQHLTGLSTRLITRLLASALDRQLAQGRSPESNSLLAARAQVLVSPAMRCALAQNWANLLAQARRSSSVMRNPRAPLNHCWIIACGPEIQEMIKALLTPLPTPARGMAMASWLLSDGTGPLYNRLSSTDLSSTVVEAIAQLDPSVSLLSSA